MEAIILVGGKGTRLRPAVHDRPKPLADISGRPFLEHLMDYLISQACNHFILATGYMSEMFETTFGDHYRDIRITYSNETKPLGTGGAVIKAQKKLITDFPFLLVNGDTFFPIDVELLVSQLRTKKADVSIALFRAQEAQRYGLTELDDTNIKSLGEGFANIGELANGGIFAISKPIPEIHKQNDGAKSFEKDVLSPMLKQGSKITGLVFDEEFIDIGTPVDYFRFSQSFK